MVSGGHPTQEAELWSERDREGVGESGSTRMSDVQCLGVSA